MHTSPQRLVLATNNAGKLREFQSLLQELHIEVLPKSMFTQEQVLEDGESFVANALLKARHAAQASGLPALADDSGLAVDALNGAPGIFSARYAGAQASDADNLHKLLHELRGVPAAQRTARYHCALVYVPDAHAEPLICNATWEGVIAEQPRGAGGFGYDPVFVLEQGCTAAELSAQQKNQLSHRGQATRQLLAALRALQTLAHD